MSNLLHRTFRRNDVGTDYVVGDIHGAFGKLMLKLQQIGFDEAKDRLFAVGDLVDRGPESHNVCQLLDKPWFFSIRGNHEEMLLGFLAGTVNKHGYRSNGGGWFIDTPRATQEYIAARLAKLPLAMTVATERGQIGIVHAECPFSNWDRFTSQLEKGLITPDEEDVCLWARTRARICLWHKSQGPSNRIAFSEPIIGVEHLFCGHTPMPVASYQDNIIYLDTGGYRHDGFFTIVDLNTLTVFDK